MIFSKILKNYIKMMVGNNLLPTVSICLVLHLLQQLRLYFRTHCKNNCCGTCYNVTAGIYMVFLKLLPVSSSAMIQPLLFVSRPFVALSDKRVRV